MSSQCLAQLSLSSLQLGRRLHHMEGAVLASCVRVFRGGSHWGGVKVSGRPRLEPGVGGPGESSEEGCQELRHRIWEVLVPGEGVKWGLPSCPVALPGH